VAGVPAAAGIDGRDGPAGGRLLLRDAVHLLQLSDHCLDWLAAALHREPAADGAAVGVASIQFFLISNFGAWLGHLAIYPYTLGGLVSCYIAAIPFYGRTLASDLCTRPLCSVCTHGSAAPWRAPNA